MKVICPACEKDNHNQCWGHKPRNGCYSLDFTCTCEEKFCQIKVEKMKTVARLARGRRQNQYKRLFNK